ncbi:hypothetical protein DFH09DRAFT_1280961, partial [Mycena vulgaris]
MVALPVLPPVPTTAPFRVKRARCTGGWCRTWRGSSASRNRASAPLGKFQSLSLHLSPIAGSLLIPALGSQCRSITRALRDTDAGSSPFIPLCLTPTDICQGYAPRCGTMPYVASPPLFPC